MKPEQVTIYLVPELSDLLRVRAAQARRKMSHLAADAIREYLDRQIVQTPQKVHSEVTDQSNVLLVASKLEEVMSTLREQGRHLDEIKLKLASMEGESETTTLPMPQGTFNEDETTILEIVCSGSSRGILAADLQSKMLASGMTVGHSKKITAALKRKGILKRKRMHWSLV